MMKDICWRFNGKILIVRQYHSKPRKGPFQLVYFKCESIGGNALDGTNQQETLPVYSYWPQLLTLFSLCYYELNSVYNLHKWILKSNNIEIFGVWYWSFPTVFVHDLYQWVNTTLHLKCGLPVTHHITSLSPFFLKSRYLNFYRF